MFNPDTVAPVSTFMPSFEMAARSLKVELITAPVHSDVEIETAIIALGREPGGGLFVMPDGFTGAHRAPIISAAARSKVPTVCAASGFVRDGGLLSYGVDQVDLFRRAATYVDRILRGEKPDDLPVQLSPEEAACWALMQRIMGLGQWMADDMVLPQVDGKRSSKGK
jgi:putative ABC transport system substrate-binding protein